MKNIKRFLLLILCFAMLFSASIPCLAADTDAVYTPQIVSRGSRILTRNETIQLLQDKVGLSLADAVKRYNEIASDGEEIITAERWVTVDIGMEYFIEVGCLVEMECGSRCNYGEVLEKWSEAVGDGVYTWNPFYVYVTVEGIGNDELRFRTRGTIEVEISRSSAAGFEAAGFTISGSIGTNYICRKTVSIDETLYPGMS